MIHSHNIRLLLRSFAGAAWLVGMTGCSMLRPETADYAPVMPEEVPDVQVANGSLFQAHHEIALFENPTARRAGDVLTIRLVESTTASKQSSTTTAKATNGSLGAGTTVLGAPITVGGNNVLNAGISNSTDFSGAGSSAQSNSLAGDVTVTVAKRYSNGNLLVRGQKWIAINQGREFVKIQGIVRQVDVQPDNTVLSTRVADASIAYGAQGALADANAKGWLARFFDSPLTPF
ncbi:MAG: flagellar basal body L-ring protein FlgH [Steroidobacteraceae bacterium]